MGLLTLRKEDNPEERDFAVGDVQIGRTSSVQMALERSVGYSGRVEAARATLDQVKVEDIDTNVAVLKELVFPLIEIGKRLVFLAEWEDPLKSYVFLLCFLYVVYRRLDMVHISRLFGRVYRFHAMEQAPWQQAFHRSIRSHNPASSTNR
uniref:Uncharacterized protein n=1 Tax=Aegilops tauschii subsp. strangulata TaxID=200361 RepID=A0A453DG12_AEGTS